MALHNVVTLQDLDFSNTGSNDKLSIRARIQLRRAESKMERQVVKAYTNTKEFKSNVALRTLDIINRTRR